MPIHDVSSSFCKDTSPFGLGPHLYELDYLFKSPISKYSYRLGDQDGGGVGQGAHLLPQKHSEHICKWNDSHRTSTERQQKTSNF